MAPSKGRRVVNGFFLRRPPATVSDLLVPGMALCAGPNAAVAQDGGSGGWQFELNPYAWGAGLDGVARINGRPQAGFGAGSTFAWQGRVEADYRFSRTFVGKVGYRHVDVDHENGGFAYDMTSAGVFAGIGVRW
jgi:hypothetical protein